MNLREYWNKKNGARWSEYEADWHSTITSAMDDGDLAVSIYADSYDEANFLKSWVETHMLTAEIVDLKTDWTIKWLSKYRVDISW